MKQKLCVIGEALIDFIPQRKGCALKDVEGFTRVAGGAPANVAGAAARLGIPAMVLTQLGADAFGDYIIQSLKDSGIDTSHILQTKEHDTSLSFVLAFRQQTAHRLSAAKHLMNRYFRQSTVASEHKKCPEPADSRQHLLPSCFKSTGRRSDFRAPWRNHPKMMDYLIVICVRSSEYGSEAVTPSSLVLYAICAGA